VSNSANFNVSGGAATHPDRQPSRTTPVACLAVAAATPLTVSGVLTQAATGASIQADASITVGADYNNLAAGSGNSFQPCRRHQRHRRGFDPRRSAAQTSRQTITGAVDRCRHRRLARCSTSAMCAAAACQRHPKNYQIANTGTTGADMRGAIQTSRCERRQHHRRTALGHRRDRR
jgi:hypothetical protein